MILVITLKKTIGNELASFDSTGSSSDFSLTQNSFEDYAVDPSYDEVFVDNATAL